jgi:hypothetical protein
MTQDDFRQAAKAIGDLRFVQAAALVGSGMNNNKQADKYMANLQRLQRILEAEALYLPAQSEGEEK